ncbi:MAG: toll/interleukin-1 receptor domain-containing protein [Bacteroidota bacterium]
MFDVFLSHNSSDKPVVKGLGHSLSREGLDVWLDEWELPPGSLWQDHLEKIIAECASATVMVGSDGLGPWEIMEMRGLLDEFVRRKMPVIPVLLPGAPQKPSLPIFLRQFGWVDFRDGISSEGIQRLVWGITQVKPVGMSRVLIVGDLVRLPPERPVDCERPPFVITWNPENDHLLGALSSIVKIDYANETVRLDIDGGVGVYPFEWLSTEGI